MKRFISFLIIFICAFLGGCSKNDPSYKAEYIYENNTGNTITVSSYSPVLENGEWVNGKEKIFSIVPGGTQSIVFDEIFGFRDPLHWDVYPPNDGDYTIVSNMTKSITYRYSNMDKIYDTKSYQVVKKEKTVRILKYSFSESDFDDAE